MRNLLNPHWLLLATTGPLALLAALCYGEFAVIHTLLPPENVALWHYYGLALLGLGLGSLAYLGWCRARGQELSAWYGVAALLAYSLWLGLYTYHNEGLLPHNGSVPRWMVPTDPLVYVWTFVMPTLAHALLVLVVRTTPLDQKPSAGFNIGLAVLVPLGSWLAALLLGGVASLLDRWLFTLWENDVFRMAFFVLMMAVGPLAFLFFLTRGIYIIVQRREDKELSTLVKVLLTLVLPLLGLAVNAGLFLGGLNSQETGIFGNFSSPWFYGLAALNGLLLCVPAERLAPRGRLALLVGRSAMLGYTGYFFLVFLPWLPLSVLAVILIGTGFLMLAPLMLLVVHLSAIGDDLAALRPHYAPRVRRLALVGGALVLPLALTASYYHSRRVLRQALEYAYTPDYAKHYDLDAPALARTLAVVQRHKDTSWDLFGSTQQPYLSAYFNWLVLDNLTLPESKIADLHQLFIGESQPNAARRWPRWTPPTNFAENQEPAAGQPQLRQLSARSTFDAREEAWVSWVDLDIANTNPALQAAEYSTAFTLPVGCWVGDYYLDVNGHREPGLLAERKAATWVYAQIVNERASRDPGLLSYIGPRQLSLRVYPVVGGAARRTGIQLLHKEPFVLAIGGRSVQLGTPAAAPAESTLAATPGGAVVYLSAGVKQVLPLVRRQPYYHFLLDVSAGQQGRKASYGQRVQRLLREQPLPGPARFSLVNTYTTPVPAGADWQAALRDFANAGGCYLTGAVRRTLTAAQLHPEATCARLVVVTDSLQDAVLPADFADLQAAYPESDAFYVLRPDGQLEAHSLRRASRQPLPAAPAPDSLAAVRAWPSAARPQAYLPDTDEAAIVLPHPAAPLAVPTSAPTRWLTGLLLHGFDQWQTLHPEAAERGHVPFIKASFQARILTPLTAYLVLENEAQKAALRRKQAEVLAASSTLDAQEAEPPHPAAVPLNEGEWLLLIVGLALGVRQLRRRLSVA